MESWFSNSFNTGAKRIFPHQTCPLSDSLYHPIKALKCVLFHFVVTQVTTKYKTATGWYKDDVPTKHSHLVTLYTLQVNYQNLNFSILWSPGRPQNTKKATWWFKMKFHCCIHGLLGKNALSPWRGAVPLKLLQNQLSWAPGHPAHKTESGDTQHSWTDQKIDLWPRLGTWGGHKMKHDMTTQVSSVLCQFCVHLGWLESLKWWQGKRVSTQWGEHFCEWGWGRGSRPWGYRMTFTKWHHEWLFELTRRHSWCHLVKVILHPQGLEFLPQLSFTEAPSSLGLNPLALSPLQGFEPS